MIAITRQQLLQWNPCCQEPGQRYSPEGLDELFAGRECLTPADVAALNIPREDVVWVWTRPGALPQDVLEAWTERIVTRAVRAHALHCGVRDVEQWAARWLSGEDRTASPARAALEATRDAAERAVALEAAWAARAAALEATRDAAAWAARATRDAAAWAAWAARDAAAAEWAARWAARAAEWAARAWATRDAAEWASRAAARAAELERQVQDLLEVTR